MPEDLKNVNESLKQIEFKMDVLIGLLTMNLSQGKSINFQIELLHSLGLGGVQIAKILGKSKGHVDKTLGMIKKKSKKSLKNASECF